MRAFPMTNALFGIAFVFVFVHDRSAPPATAWTAAKESFFFSALEPLNQRNFLRNARTTHPRQ
jgi:hypothetical protein